MVPKSHQNQLLVRKGEKPSGTGNPTNFSIELRSLGPKNEPKSIENHSKIEVKMGRTLDKDFSSLLHVLFGPKTLQTHPKWLPKDAKMAPKTLPRRFPDLQEAPKIPPRPSTMPSRRPKTSPRRSKRPSRAAKTAKMTPKRPPRQNFEGFWEPTWRHVGTKIA